MELICLLLLLLLLAACTLARRGRPSEARGLAAFCMMRPTKADHPDLDFASSRRLACTDSSSLDRPHC